jgi:hypothetical protein
MGSGESREALEGLIDDIDQEEWEVARRYHPGRFDRWAINQTLAALALSVQGGFPPEIHDPSAHRRHRRSTADRADPDD